MELKFFLFLFVLCCSVKGDEIVSDLISYEQLNTMEMMETNQNFIIKATEESIAYFDSLDRNAFVYITTEEEKFLSGTDERISGKFKQIEPNVIYYVRINFISGYYTSNLIKYVYPTRLYDQKIIIKGTNLNYLYLQKGNTYTLNFNDDTFTNRLIKLSRKTLNTEIVINGELGLNKDNLYYKLESDFRGELVLEVKENDAFIELLSGDEDYDTLTDVNLLNHEIKNDTTIIIIEKTQKDFYLRLTSSEEFSFSFSYDFSDEETYFYDNMKPCLKAKKQETEGAYIVYYRFLTPYKSISVSDKEFLTSTFKEFFTFTVKVLKKPEQKIILNYRQESLIDPLLDEQLDKSYCENIIRYLSELFDLYIFTDIAKNPPKIKDQDNYHHRKIDIKNELARIKTENRYFYDFYQEVMSIIATIKDLHLSLYALKTPKKHPFASYGIVLPFQFIIKQDKDQKYKLFIKLNEYIEIYDEGTQKLAKSCENIPLKTINDMDPFDYVQQFSKFRVTKNVHAQFTLTINNVISEFNLIQSPLNYCDFAMNDYEFENNVILRLGYLVPQVKLEDTEFNKFYKDYIQLKQKEMQSEYFKFPTIKEVKEQYEIYKGIRKEKDEMVFKSVNEEKIKWDVILYGDAKQTSFLKCRVDEENGVNVVVQNSFSLGYYNGIIKIIECAKLFHTNNYPIIIIESLNGGGTAQLYMVMHQLFQMRTVDRSYFSFRMNDYSKNFYKNIYYERTNVKTCEQVNYFNDFGEVKDHYNYNGENIEHIRTEAVDIVPFYFRNILKEFREEYKDNQNLKKPTDIIIFTDSFSYSATSGLIKGFQNTGGAIIVGYYGNPKLNSTDLFDGSQSISSVEQNLQDLDAYNKLYQLGFNVAQVTAGETFDDSVYGDNPIPREYAFDPVDYKVDIYSTYSDDNYEEFIKQGKIIHDKFNKENYCNPKNEKLLLHSDCTIEGKEHAHGGYRCKSDKNEWDTDNCQPYYCDIGYYYNQFKEECMEECSFDDTKSYLILGDVDEEIYEIDNNTLTTFSFINETNNLYYFYNSSEDLVYGYPKIGFVKAETLFINRDKNAKHNFTFTINKVITNTNIVKFNFINYNGFKVDQIFLIGNKQIFVFEAAADFIFYGNKMLHAKENKLKYTTYNGQMTLKDILDGNENYFKEYKNEDSYLTLSKYEINILYFDCSGFEQIHYYLAPKNTNENIFITGTDTNFIFLQKDKTYELDFTSNTVNRLIKLSRKTPLSKITILDENDPVVLDSDNIYYEIKVKSKDKIKLEVKNSDAIIEFLFELNYQTNMNFNDKSSINSVGKYHLIRIGKQYFSKRLSFKLKGEENNLQYNIFLGYSKSDYTYYDFKSTSKLISKTNESQLDIIIEDIKLMDGEGYYVLFVNLGKSIQIVMSVDGSSHDEGSKGGDSLETWAIALIVIASILALLLIVFIIIYCIKKGSRLTNEKIEDKMQGLTDV